MGEVNPFIILIAAIFTNNILLANFLGMCPFVAISKQIKSAFGMGVAVTFVMTLTATLNWLVYELVLEPYNLEFLKFLVFIIVIAAAVQFVEMVIEKSSPTLYMNLGVFLPLITVNCAILGVSLLMGNREYSFIQSLAFGIGSGIGWWMAIMAMAGLRHRIQFSNVPKALQDPGITMLIAGVMAMAFQGFAGIVNI